MISKKPCKRKPGIYIYIGLLMHHHNMQTQTLITRTIIDKLTTGQCQMLQQGKSW